MVGSVSGWLEALREGDQDAATELWRRFIDGLVALARRRLDSANRRVFDEEDLAHSVFFDLCRGLQEDRFPNLHDRNDLWQVLLMLTNRRAVDQIRKENTAKRGGGNVPQRAVDQERQPLDRRPLPEDIVELSDTLDALLEKLKDQLLMQIALDKMSGFTNSEIAQRQGISLRSVERKLGMIRQIWSDKFAGA